MTKLSVIAKSGEWEIGLTSNACVYLQRGNVFDFDRSSVSDALHHVTDPASRWAMAEMVKPLNGAI